MDLSITRHSEIMPQIFTAKVMHKRLLPKVNAFSYGVYYIALPLPLASCDWQLPSRFLKFYHKDHGAKNGSDITNWARTHLETYGLSTIVSRITFVTMPRVLGYVFNPVSFYFCFDESDKIRAVICAVHNTFGEQHSYICAKEDKGEITPETWLEAKKFFHVSPFLKREGHYRFRFLWQGDALSVWIDYYNADGNKQLMTSLSGNLMPLNAQSLDNVFWKHPFVTMKAILLIHWQALKLLTKGIKFISKPKQKPAEISTSFGVHDNRVQHHNLNTKDHG